VAGVFGSIVDLIPEPDGYGRHPAASNARVMHPHYKSIGAILLMIGAIQRRVPRTAIREIPSFNVLYE